jgi:hypothetical protein
VAPLVLDISSTWPSTAHQDNLLMAEVSRVNGVLGRYVLRFLDADAGRAEPLGIADERALAGQVADLAGRLRARAARREHEGEPRPLVAGVPHAISDKQTP